MEEIRYAQLADRAFWQGLDAHLPPAQFEAKVRARQAYVLRAGGEPAGLLRYGLFWDEIPFCTLLMVREGCRGRGCGAMLLRHWEADMKRQGHGLVLTSTRADEAAQHFYRRLGYKDCGGLVLDAPGYAQPMELFLCREI